MTTVLIILFLALAGASSLASAQGEEASGGLLKIIVMTMVLVIIPLILVWATITAVVRIMPYEVGLKVVLGKYAGMLNPGLSFVPPFITKVIRVDLREQVFEGTDQDLVFRDKRRGLIDYVVYLKVVDAEKASFQVSNYKLATVALVQTSLRRAVSQLTFGELVDNQELICKELKERMREETDPWGVKVDRFELGEMREN